MRMAFCEGVSWWSYPSKELKQVRAFQQPGKTRVNNLQRIIAHKGYVVRSNDATRSLASFVNLLSALIHLMNDETLNVDERPSTVFAPWALPPHIDQWCGPNNNVEA